MAWICVVLFVCSCFADAADVQPRYKLLLEDPEPTPPPLDAVSKLLSAPEYFPGEWKDYKMEHELKAALQKKKVAFERALKPTSNCSSALVIDKGLHLRLPEPSEYPWGKLLTDTEGIQPVEGATLEMVNAGMGTSATRTLHEEVCALRKSSLHYSRHCWASRSVLDLQANLIRLYDNLKKCARGEYTRTDERCRAETHRVQLLGNLSAMVSSGVKMLSDVPYTNLVPVLRRMVPGLKVAQTLRGSEEWTPKRLSHNTEDPICKEPRSTLAKTYFDYYGCLIGRKWLGDAFVPQGRMLLAGDVTEYRAYRVLAAKYSHHNHLIANTTWPAVLRQLCAWDEDEWFDIQIRDTARSLTHGGSILEELANVESRRKEKRKQKHGSFLSLGKL